MQLQQRAGERVASASEVPECQREFQNQAKVVVKWRVWKFKRPLKGLWACPAPLHALAALAALAGPGDDEFGLHLCEQPSTLGLVSRAWRTHTSIGGGQRECTTRILKRARMQLRVIPDAARAGVIC